MTGVTIARTGPAGRRALTLGNVLRSLRAFSLPVSVLPVFVAVASVLPPGRWDWGVLLFSAAGAGLLHLGGNLLNDYFDFRRGVDHLEADDSTRPGRLLVSGRLHPRDVLAEALICLTIAGAVSVWLVWRLGPGVLLWAGTAVVLLYSYTGWPFHLKYRALGEAVIFVTFGPLLLTGAAWAQTGEIEPAAVLLSVPVGLATTSILVGNNIRDLDEDAAAGIRTLARIVGARIARAGYVTLTVGAAVLPSLFAAAGWLPLPLLVTPLALPLLSGPLTAVAKGRRLADIDARTARFEAVLLLLMWAGCMVGWFWE